jgi:hypothetical protein
LDREFAGQLVGFTEAFVKLGSNLAEIEAAHTTAVKAVEAEKKKGIENKRKGSVSKATSTATETKPGPLVRDGKPVFETRTVTAETPSLFDSPMTCATSAESERSLPAPNRRSADWTVSNLSAWAGGPPKAHKNPRGFRSFLRMSERLAGG